MGKYLASIKIQTVYNHIAKDYLLITEFPRTKVHVNCIYLAVIIIFILYFEK